MGPTYEIRIRGRVGEVVASAFVGFDVSTRNVETVLSGPVADQADLFTVLARLQSFGFELVDVRQLATPSSGHPAPEDPPPEDPPPEDSPPENLARETPPPAG